MYSRADFYVYNRYSSREEKEEKNMEYLTGVKPKETKEISELLEQTEAGTKVKSTEQCIRSVIWELLHL